MIKAVFEYGKNGEVTSFTVEGHGGIGLKGRKATKGNDILCAGVSTLVQGVIVGLKYVTNANPNIETKESGLLDCKIGSPENKETKALLNTLIISLKNLEEQFPENLKIEILR